MYRIRKFEYDIALRIFTYDLDNINKEINKMNCLKDADNRESTVTYCTNRLFELAILRDKKIKQINDLHKKYGE